MACRCLPTRENVLKVGADFRGQQGGGLMQDSDRFPDGLSCREGYQAKADGEMPSGQTRDYGFLRKTLQNGGKTNGQVI